MSPKALSKKIGRELAKSGKSLALAESCTGGFISHLITTIPGSSAYYKGGIISYDNEVKKDFLGVKTSTLKKFGAVSEECATEMVKGVQKKMSTDYAIATTGIAGPTGAVPGKPVGTVYIACAGPKKLIVKRLSFKGSRSQVIAQSGKAALEMLLDLL